MMFIPGGMCEYNSMMMITAERLDFSVGVWSEFLLLYLATCGVLTFIRRYRSVPSMEVFSSLFMDGIGGRFLCTHGL